MAKILWNPQHTYPSSSTSDEKTWIVVQQVTCSNLTKITFKAGSKDYVLTNDNLGGTSTEYGLKKKLFLFMESIIVGYTKIKIIKNKYLSLL